MEKGRVSEGEREGGSRGGGRTGGCRLTNNEEAALCPRQGDVHLVLVDDEAEVPLHPALAPFCLNLEAGQRANSGKEDKVPLTTCNVKRERKRR